MGKNDTTNKESTNTPETNQDAPSCADMAQKHPRTTPSTGPMHCGECEPMRQEDLSRTDPFYATFSPTLAQAHWSYTLGTHRLASPPRATAPCLAARSVREALSTLRPCPPERRRASWCCASWALESSGRSGKCSTSEYSLRRGE